MESNTQSVGALSKQMRDSTFKLPTIAEIYAAGENMPTLQQDSILQVLLNQPPRPEWIKEHPFITQQVIVSGKKVDVPIKYIPIQRIEWLLTNVFVRWKVSIKWTKLVANSVEVCVRLWCYDHVMRRWMYQDGVGAQPLQTASGAGATEFDRIKSNAVQIALPAAKSYAVKDAAEQYGKLFGKDLNRADAIGYDSLVNRYENVKDKPPTYDELKALFDSAEPWLSKEEKFAATRILDGKEENSYLKLWKELIAKGKSL
jgi:hypothetical protein